MSGTNVVPIRPTIGMSRLDQLKAFVAVEQENTPDKTHIAAWALSEIERLSSIITKFEEDTHL